MIKAIEETIKYILDPHFYPIIDSNGDHNWFDKNGYHHREDGPAKINEDGEEWWWHGYLHREGGPAKISSRGNNFWYKKGALHREDGPAITRPEGYNEYWIDGRELTKEEWKEYVSSKSK